jgi:DNA-binding GntR family transcriptional regulator
MHEGSLDRDSELHIYEQIAGAIAAQIEAGALQPRRPIPSESTLMQMYPGVARTTIRRAINRLRELGLVYTVPGRGSYVTPPEDRPVAE